MAKISFKFNYQALSGTYGKLNAVTASTPTVLTPTQVWAAFKIVAPDGTTVKDIPIGFDVNNATTPTAFDLVNIYAANQTWAGINIPTDSTGAFMKGVYTITTCLKYDIGGNITSSNEVITYNFCPVSNTASANSTKLVRTLNCAGGILKLDDLTSYTGYTVTSHTLTITPPSVSLLPSVTTSLYSLQTVISYTNASYGYGLTANGNKTTAVTPTPFFDCTYEVKEFVTWSTATSVFVACATLCSVASCAKKALSELESKRLASGKVSETDQFTHDKIVDRLVLIQTDMLCGGTNIDQYLSELQTIIQGICNCGATSTTPTPFVNSMTV